jgi:hypothetical protein
MNEPSNSQVRKKSTWRQITIVLLSSLVLAISCCGGGFALAGSPSKFLADCGRALIIVGWISLLFFVLTILVAIIKLLLTLVSGFRR